MKGSKYLSEIIKERDMKLGSNTMILAPVGSGKSYWVFNELIVGKKMLYLCDTNNLEEAMRNEKESQCLLKGQIEIKTYQWFGVKTKSDMNDDYINSFDIIVCDEVQNLLRYMKINDNAILQFALYRLLRIYENTQILFLTATPNELWKFEVHNKEVAERFTTYNLLEDKEIRRYVDKRKGYIGHISQIPYVLREYEDSFKYRDLKCMVFTSTIDEMKTIENYCINENLIPISIWSTNNEKHPMNEEQLKVREHLLSKGELLEPYNALILNKASETGINIYDKDIELVIVNSADKTFQTQARGRVRHDIDLLVLKDIRETNITFISIGDDLLNVWLTKEQLQHEIELAGLRNNKRQLYSVNALMKALAELGYPIEKKRMRTEGVQATFYMIKDKIDK